MEKITKVILLLSLIFIISCSPQQEQYTGDNKMTLDDLNDELCEAENGYWNECGSLCAGEDPNNCIAAAVCNPQCECGGIVGYRCPGGFKCKLFGGIADEMGVCIPV